MFASICILGRQPSLGLAELESLFGAQAIQPVGDCAALLDIAPGDVPFSRLGGTVKLCKVLTVLDITDWNKICASLEETVSNQIADLPKGKIKLGLSLYGFDLPVRQISYAGLSIKKVIKKAGHSARIIPNTTPALNSAQVLHNQLTGRLGMELVVVHNNNKTILAQTVAEQDIASYTLRDRGRPKRDARVGMLPPKLAQIIVNLAVGNAGPQYGSVILDPFCGTGVILQEATISGFDTYGTDVDARMVEYTDQNLKWLLGQPCCPIIRPESTLGDDDWRYFKLEVGDATNHSWSPKPNFIATETYLGRPFTTKPDDKTLAATVNDCNVIIKKFLGNIANQTKSGLRFCLAVPAWRVNDNFIHLPLLDSLTDMGYTRLSFVHADNRDLIYYREGQIVARELVIITRI